MPLNIVSITPINNSINIPIDSKIEILFDQPIDPFTVQNGIGIYISSESLWTGPDLSILDSKYSDVLTIGEDYSYYNYNYTIDGNKVIISTIKPFIENKKHYISIYPGNDISKFITSKTTNDPEYIRIDQSTGTLDIVSAFSGSENGTYQITFINETSAIVSFPNKADKTIEFIANTPVSIGNLFLTLSGIFEPGDTVTIDCFTGSGLTSIYKCEFVTSQYETIIPQSVKIENINQISSNDLRLIDTIPKNLSVDNDKINPITLKFNKTIQDQDIQQNISINRIDWSNSRTKSVNYYYKITDNIIKIYLLSV